jgi:ketosteroid isomerase-like protein
MFLALIPAVSAADNQVVKQEIQAEYMKADAATRTKDINALMAHYTSDFKLKMLNGKILSLDKVKDNIIWQFVATKQVKELSFRIQTIKVNGNSAEVLVRQTENLQVMMEGKQHTIEGTQISEDTWTKTPAGWKLKLQVVKLSNITQDGKLGGSKQ